MRSERMSSLSFLCESLRWLPSDCWSSTLRGLRRGLSPGGRRPAQVLIVLDAVGAERMHPYPMPGDNFEVAAIQQVTNQISQQTTGPAEMTTLRKLQRVPSHCLADSGTAFRSAG